MPANKSSMRALRVRPQAGSFGTSELIRVPLRKCLVQYAGWEPVRVQTDLLRTSLLGQPLEINNLCALRASVVKYSGQPAYLHPRSRRGFRTDM